MVNEQKIMEQEKDKKRKASKVPVILFISVLVFGVLVAFFANPQNDLQRYCFAVIISLGAGLGATYLTGTITGGGKFGFLNIKSVTGGFAVWLITFATFIYFFPKLHIKTYPTIAGKWLYICSGHDGKYQHGGRFIATQTANEWLLNGERMWKDILNTKEKKWNCSVYNPTKSWHSVWGNIGDNEIRFEYLIENVDGEDIHGYAKGLTIVNDKNEIVKIKGIFNQLFPSKQISGEVELIRVSDNFFNNPNWTKNHKCGE